MKLALLASNGETVALASRLIGAGASACTARLGEPLPACDWLLFDESAPLASHLDRNATKLLLGEALANGKPLFAFLSPNAPATPKCAVVMTELLGYSSAAAATPSGTADILGIDADPSDDDGITAFSAGDDSLARMAALSRELSRCYDLTFSLIFDPDEDRGVLFAGNAYDIITATSIESAIAELFRSAPASGC